MSSLDYLKKLRVVVAVPSMGTWHERFGVSLVHMLMYCQSHAIRPSYKTQEINLASLRGSILPNLRLDAVKHAIESKAEFLVFIDSDQTFPAQTLHRLISHNKDCVAANIATKQIPAQPTARKRGAGPNGFVPVYTDPDSAGLEKVDRIGCGIMCLKTAVFDKIGLKVMEMRWREEIQRYGGEDWPICEALELAGMEIFIDHDLSKRVGHVGEYIYTHDVVGEIAQVPLDQLETKEVAANG